MDDEPGQFALPKSLRSGRSLMVTFSSWSVNYYFGEQMWHVALGWLSILWLRCDGEDLLSTWPMLTDERQSLHKMLHARRGAPVDGDHIIHASSRALEPYTEHSYQEFAETFDARIDVRVNAEDADEMEGE